MARVSPVTTENITPAQKVAFDRHVQQYSGIITNTKATLGHSLPAFEAYMKWYPLFESVEHILGRKAACHFAYAISVASHCKVCTCFFRKSIIEEGSNPDNADLTIFEKALTEFGSAIVKYHGNIADHVYNEVAKRLTETEIVTLVAFAGQMIAATVFNNTLETEPDSFVASYLPESVFW